MVTIVTSLYKSEQHLPRFIRKAHRVSAYLERHGIAHEFLLLPNSPNAKEEKILAHAAIPHSRILPRALESLNSTWNAGIEEAAYEHICFWNVDDIRFGSAIRSGYDTLRTGTDIVYFPFIYLRFIMLLGFKVLVKAVVIRPPAFSKERFSREMHSGPFFMFTKKAFRKVGPFDASFKIAGDFDWCARAAIADLEFVRSARLAGIFTNDGTTLSGSRDSKHQSENERVYALTGYKRS